MIPGASRFKPDQGLVFLLRHGKVSGDAVKRYIGQTDVILTQYGCRQAEQWAASFATIPLQRIVCSDLKRSLESARILANRCALKPEVAPDLREIHLGRWEGLAFSDVAARFPEAFEQRGRDIAAYRPPDGESFQDLQQRVVPYFQNLLQQTRQNILFVGHAGVNRVLLCHLLGMPLQNLFSLGQDHAGLSIVARRAGGRAFRLVLLNLLPQPPAVRPEPAR